MMLKVVSVACMIYGVSMHTSKYVFLVVREIVSLIRHDDFSIHIPHIHSREHWGYHTDKKS